MSSIESELRLLLPIIVLGVGALCILMREVFSSRPWSREGWLAGTIAIALILLICDYDRFLPGGAICHGLVYVDPYTWFAWLVLLFAALFSVTFSSPNFREEGIEAPGEFAALHLMTTAGALVFVSAAELITLFLGLEIMSLGLYCLCGSAIARKESVESALKYFLLGSFSSAFLLFGMALLYGVTGSTSIDSLGAAALVTDVQGGLVKFGLGLLLVGFAFKMAAVPFHFWTPDVYQGAPTVVTGYMASVVKAAAVFTALRVLWGGFFNMVVLWAGAVSLIAVLTMTLGNLLALRQKSVKRMLAYSSIANAGYMLLAFLAPGEQAGGGPALLFYMVTYAVMTLGAFGVVIAVTRGEAGPDGDDISRFEGIGYRAPLVGVLMSIFLLALAGLPPGMAGLLGKFYLFSAAVKANYTGLVIVAVLNSAVSVAYYLRVIVAMYFREGSEQELPPVRLPLAATIALCAVLTVMLGIFPSALYNLASRVMFAY